MDIPYTEVQFYVLPTMPISQVCLFCDRSAMMGAASEPWFRRKPTPKPNKENLKRTVISLLYSRWSDLEVVLFDPLASARRFFDIVAFRAIRIG